jgi:hypothetical protein
MFGLNSILEAPCALPCAGAVGVASVLAGLSALAAGAIGAATDAALDAAAAAGRVASAALAALDAVACAWTAGGGGAAYRSVALGKAWRRIGGVDL